MATIAQLTVDLVARTARFSKGFNQAENIMQRFQRTARRVTRDLDSIARVGRQSGLYLAALAASAGGVVKVAADFEQAMTRVGSISRATAEEFQLLEKTALDLAKSTKYTASEVAEGMEFMAMAGFNVTQTVAAMPSVLQLAAAGMIDLGTAADITTNILTGYGLEIEQLAWANDILVSAMTGANVNLQMLGESFKYVGPVARGAGVAFETTTAAIALLGNAGIQGSMAGTSLRQALSRLLNPTKAVQDRLRKLGVQTKTATGELLPFENIIAQLEKSGATAADMMEIFGDRAGPAMTALVSQGSNALLEFIDRLRESGGLAERLEREQLNTLSGQLLILKSQFEGVAISIGQDLMPYARTLVEMTQRLVTRFDNLTDTQRDQIAQWIALGAAILGIVTVLGITAGAISAFIKGLMLLGTVVSLISSPVVVGLSLIALAVGLMATAWNQNWFGIQEKTQAAWAIISPILENMWNWLQRAWIWVIDTAGDVWQWLTETTWTEKIEDIKGWLDTAWTWTVNTAGTAWEWFMNTKFGQWLDEMRQKITDSSAWKWTIDVAFPAFMEGTQAVITAVVEVAGEMYEAIKTGLQTGDWGAFWSVSSEVWSRGVLLSVSILSVVKGLAALKGIILAGLGAIPAMGIPGVIGAITIAIQLMEAMTDGGFEQFGANLATALAAGIGIGVFTGSPYAGALAFTIVLNLKLGETVQEAARQIRSQWDSFYKGLTGHTPDEWGAKYYEWIFGTKPKGFQTGGYTGNYPVDMPVGVVHGQEWVIPEFVWKRGLPAILEFMGMEGFQTGRITGTGLAGARTTVIDMNNMFSQLGSMILTGFTKLFEVLLNAIEVLATAIVGDERVEEIKEYFEMLRQNIKDFGDTVRDFLDNTPTMPEDPQQETISLWQRFNNQLQISTHLQSFFSAILTKINAVAQFFGLLLQELSPIIETLMVPIVLVAQALATLLLPVIKILFNPLKWLGVIVITVAELIARVWNALLDLLSKIPGVDLKKYKVNVDELSRAKKELIDLTWEDAENFKKLNEEVGEAVRNVPQGLKIVSHRLAAAGYSVPGVQAVVRQEVVDGGGDYAIHVHFDGNVYGMDDFDRRVRQAVAQGNRQMQLAMYGV